MISVETYEPKRISSLVKCFWRLEVSQDLDSPYEEDIVPDGHHEIIFHLNARATRKRANAIGWLDEPVAFFTGQNKKAYKQRLDPGAILYGIRFHPHTQRIFYEFPASLVTDNLIPLSDMAGTDTLSACIDQSSLTTFGRLEQAMIKKTKQLRTSDYRYQYVDAAVKTILKSKGTIRVGMLKKVTGVTTRHLEKAFMEYVGITPKYFSNIIRFNNFLMLKKSYPTRTLTECAHEAEFHDQSHLIHLSRIITGESPKAYFSRSNFINNLFLEK